MRIFNELFILVYYWWYVFTLVLLMINERQAKMYKPIWQCLMCMFYLICDIIIFKEIYRFFRKIYRFSYRFLIKNRIFWNGYTDFPKFQVVMSDITGQKCLLWANALCLYVTSSGAGLIWVSQVQKINYSANICLIELILFLLERYLIILSIYQHFMNLNSIFLIQKNA